MRDVSPDSFPLRARDRVGTVLDQKWRLDELLGVGGTATVYAATHRNGSRVAVKVLHPELSSIPDVRRRFLREGYLANTVAHPGTVSVLDDDVADDGTVFLVMELLAGETLQQRWERKGRRFPEVFVLSIADAVLDVLASAHVKGIVHRDVKPENVFLVRGKGVKILDFGIARLAERSANGLGAAGATMWGATMGTPAFMPPEQARGRWDEVDARSDVWAMGATMFAFLAGRHVRESATVNEQLFAAMSMPAPPIRSVAPEVSPALAHVVDRALAFRREDRWRDARAMQVAVRQARGDTDGRPESRTQLPSPAPSLRPPRASPRALAHRARILSAVPLLRGSGVAGLIAAAGAVGISVAAFAQGAWLGCAAAATSDRPSMAAEELAVRAPGLSPEPPREHALAHDSDRLELAPSPWGAPVPPPTGVPAEVPPPAGSAAAAVR